jgi:molecular chaperone GrpE
MAPSPVPPPVPMPAAPMYEAPMPPAPAPVPQPIGYVQPLPTPPPVQRKRRKGLIIGLTSGIAGVVALALVAVFVIVPAIRAPKPEDIAAFDNAVSECRSATRDLNGAVDQANEDASTFASEDNAAVVTKAADAAERLEDCLTDPMSDVATEVRLQTETLTEQAAAKSAASDSLATLAAAVTEFDTAGALCIDSSDTLAGARDGAAEAAGTDPATLSDGNTLTTLEDLLDANATGCAVNEIADDTDAIIAHAEDMTDAVAEANAKAEEYLNMAARLQADFDNFRKRTEKENEEFRKYATGGMAKSLLTILDDMDRALGTADDESELVIGIRGIRNNLMKLLEENGITEISTDCKFDPNLHEALCAVEADTDGEIAEVFQKGYRLNDRIIRYPKVKVTKKKESDKTCQE